MCATWSTSLDARPRNAILNRRSHRVTRQHFPVLRVATHRRCLPIVRRLTRRVRCATVRLLGDSGSACPLSQANLPTPISTFPCHWSLEKRGSAHPTARQVNSHWLGLHGPDGLRIACPICLLRIACPI